MMRNFVIKHGPESAGNAPKPVPPAPAWLRQGLNEPVPQWEAAAARTDSRQLTPLPSHHTPLPSYHTPLPSHHTPFPQSRDSGQNVAVPPGDPGMGEQQGYDPYAVGEQDAYQNDQYYGGESPDGQGYAPAGPVDDQYGQGYYDPSMGGMDQYPEVPPDDPHASSSLANQPVPEDLSPEAMPTPLGIRGSRASRMLYLGHLPYESGKTPIPGAAQEEYVTPAPTESKTMIDTQRFGSGEADQRPSRLVRVSGVVEAPAAVPPVSQVSPTPGITSKPEQNSDPNYHQLGLQGFERKDAGLGVDGPAPTISVGAGVTAEAMAQGASTFKAPSIADLGRIPPPNSPEVFGGGFAAGAAAAPPPMAQPTASPYAGQGFGEKRGPAVDQDGRPLFVPDLPEEREDEGAHGRRVAAVAWLLFALIAGSGIALGLKEVALAGSIATPIAVVGLLMFTGKKWSGTLGLLGAVVHAGALAWVARMLLQGDESFLARIHLDNPPPPLFGQLFYGVAGAFLLGNLMMLISKPGVLRAIIGAVFVVLPMLGVTGTLAINEVRPMVANPLGNASPAIIHLDDEGISFVKPAGWLTYTWADVPQAAPVAKDLRTAPRAFYLNERQDLMFAVYFDDGAKPALAQLFGGDKLTPLELEVTRGLPPVGKEDETFDLQGKTLLENVYEGTTQSNAKLSIITNKTQLGGRMLLIAMMRDMRANPDAVDASRALDSFYKSFEFAGPKGNDTPDGENTGP